MNKSTQIAPVGQGSLTERATEVLLKAIFDGHFPDNKLPNEPELAVTLNVSRTTVRSALQSLERLGVITRAPGRGTTILPHVGRNAIALQRLIGFSDLLTERYEDVHVDQDFWVAACPNEVAISALDIEADTPMLMTSKLYVADGQPAIHIHDEIPMSHFDEHDRSNIEQGRVAGMLDSIFSLSKSWPNREITHTVVELGSDVAPPTPDFPLTLSQGEPYLVLGETHYTSAGEPVAHSTVRIDNRFLRLQVVRHL